MEKIKNVYISTSCNQCTNALHWGKNNLICFAACNSVCIYNPEFGSGGKIISTLVKHKGRVNSVRWLSGSDIFEDEIVSGSTDNSLIVWRITDHSFSSAAVLSHTSNVLIVDGLYKGRNKSDALVVGAGMDGTIKIWFRKMPSEQFNLNQNIDFGYNICIALRLFNFEPIKDKSQQLLAITLDDCSIRIYVEQENEFSFGVNLNRHEDWVCGLDFRKDGNDLLLASSSQDSLFRIWRFTQCDKEEYKAYRLVTPAWQYNIYMEAVQAGHSSWVYSVAWNPQYKSLVSSSWDKTMVTWDYNIEYDFWMENIRVGEIGGNTLGFFGGMFSPIGDSMIGYGYNGAFHLWKKGEIDWSPMVQIGGHFRSVNDAAWEPEGSYVFSVSSDQTCRIHAPWSTEGKTATWHEIARPQVHGYDINSIAILSKYRYASASEEKVIRIFTAPRNFIENYKSICKIEEDSTENKEKIIGDTSPEGAAVPSLGLSNKAVYKEHNNEQSKVKNSKDIYPEESHFNAVHLDEPPTEETLIQNTLWPETLKLYGHGYEVYCLASSPDGQYLASACKSTTQVHAAVLLWNTTDWKLLQKLISHSLTVTQICFSPDSQRILTVSRDRRWSIFEKKDEQFTLTATTNKATGVHSRIIWCCTWSHDSKFFATGSRDGKLVVWKRNPDKIPENVLGQYEPASKCLVLPENSITAVAAAPCFTAGKYLFAVGLESGMVSLYTWTLQSWDCVLAMNQSLAHHMTIKRIQFRPKLGQAGQSEVDENILQFVTCSADNSVKIYDLFLNELIVPVNEDS